MKISHLMELLAQIKREHGDAEIYAGDSEHSGQYNLLAEARGYVDHTGMVDTIHLVVIDVPPFASDRWKIWRPE